MSKITANYKKILGINGLQYSFYCDLSGALVCTTSNIQSASQEEELLLAWESEGEKHFNKCHKCGKWVIDAMYNADVLECVECAPYEEDPLYCKHCGIKIDTVKSKCPKCGKPLLYEGGADWND